MLQRIPNHLALSIKLYKTPEVLIGIYSRYTNMYLVLSSDILSAC